MGNNKSQQSVTSSVEKTDISRNVNSTVHFDNIYNFHAVHAQQIKDIEKSLMTLTSLIIGILVLIVISVIAKICYKIYKKHLSRKLDERAKVMALEMLEKGVYKTRIEQK